jgi:hypothetical protein
MPEKLERAVLSFSRDREYFDPRELAVMTGQPIGRFPAVLVKELMDNALDAAEASAPTPVVTLDVRCRPRSVLLVVRDNGGGIAPAVVEKIADFRTRTSDKSAYAAPTRGAQGNALKTVLGIPYALGGPGAVVIEARGVRHVLRPDVDPADAVNVSLHRQESHQRAGTLVKVALPTKACRGTDFGDWAWAFALFNPHATVRFRQSVTAGKQAKPGRGDCRHFYQRTAPEGWRKFLPTDLTSPWWYDPAAFARLVFGQVGAVEQAQGRDLTLREFVRQFAGLSGTAKAKAVCDTLPGVKRLSDFRHQGDEAAGRLLSAMWQATHPPSPAVLGTVGEAHLRRRLDRRFGVRRWWYRKVSGDVDGMAFVIEAALAHTDKPGRLYHGVNFSPTFEDPLAATSLGCAEFAAWGISGFLERAHAAPDGKRCTAAAFHLVCPVLQFLDRGKTRLKVPETIALAAGKALWAVAKEMYGEGERRRKDAARQERADRRFDRLALRSLRQDMTLKDAVFEVIPAAVRTAAGGLGRVSAHTLFYHVRPLIQPLTSRELTSDYFEQTLLPAYRREVGPLPEVYYEPRGTLYEPHGGRVIPLGTREVEDYVFPSWLYDKILFVEKKGLWPVLEAARLAERYDMAIVAGEGYSCEACRVLFSQAEKGQAYQLFVAHDADPHGYNIARTLRDETIRMPGYRVQVIDLGLRLADARNLGLPTEEFTRRKALPQGLVLDAVEREHFEGRPAGSKAWVCRRVELNAFSGPALVTYLEEGLAKNGVRGKVVPPADILRDAFEQAVRERVRTDVALEWQSRIEAEVQARLDACASQIAEAAARMAVAVPARLADVPSLSWRTAVQQEAVSLPLPPPAEGSADVP